MTQPRIAEVSVANQTFQFELCERELQLGTGVNVKYYWMDSREFRSKNRGINFDACLNHAWASMEAKADFGRNNEDLELLVLAEIYRYVKVSKKLQTIYEDAFPHAAADRELLSTDFSTGKKQFFGRTHIIDDGEEARLKDVVATRSLDRIQAELDALFHRSRATLAENNWIDRKFTSIVFAGMNACRSGGRAGLQSHIQNVISPWISNQRKRGGQPQCRRFLNIFSYECKVSFYTTYSFAWGRLLETWKATKTLDPLSERVMRFWHYQNPAVEHTEGNVKKGNWVFAGQILALHPLAAVVFQEPRHLQVLDKWLGHPNYDDFQINHTVHECSEYWDVVLMILVAGHEYQHARQTSELARTTKIVEFDDAFNHFHNDDDDQQRQSRPRNRRKR